MSFPILGILLHGVGTFTAAICFTPQHRVSNWTYGNHQNQTPATH